MKYFLLLIAVLFTTCSFAQVLFMNVPAERRYDDINLKFHDGYVVQAGGDTLAGKILFVPLKGDSIFSLVIDNKILNVDSIESIRVKGSDTTLSNLTYTEFRKLKRGSNVFYRKLMDGKIELYDDWLLVDEQPGEVCFDDMMIGRDNEIKNVTNFWTTSDKKFLVRKVNALMGTDLRFHQFKSKFAVLNWLKKNI
jgi:hypothetical protein